jgi:hypothetical protein
MSDRFYDSDEDVVTTSHNDKVRLKQLEDEVFMLRKDAKEKDRIIKNYEETISKYSIEDIKEIKEVINFSHEEIGNIMNNQAFIIVKNVKE